jgi:two-component system sensor histidine kinase KdpD
MGNMSLNVMDTLCEDQPQSALDITAKSTHLEPRSIALALVAVAGAASVAMVLWPLIGLENVDLVFLTGIVVIAVRYGLWPSIIASAVSSLCYNFFFIAPYYTFTISDPMNVIAVLFFTVVAVIVSNVAAHARVQTLTAMARARTTDALYTFSRKLVGVGTLDDALWATAHQIASMLKVKVLLLLPESESIAVKAAYPPDGTLDETDFTAARWVWQSGQPGGRESDTLPGAKWLFLPVRTGRGMLAVIGVASDKSGPLLAPDERRLLDALIDQSALAIERVRLVEDMDRVKRAIETERLRSALLTSISHDLKTPLSAVLGAAGALRDLSARLTDDQRSDLLSTIIEESERLNRFIANLLDMTKLESGAVVPNTALYDLHEIVGSALRRAEKIIAHHQVELDLAEDVPLLGLDAVLFEQVLFNLLDNASKYAPHGTAITIRSRRVDDSVTLQMIDEGQGISPDDLDHVFDKFYRAQKRDQVRAGTGLGLAISRGFIEAMHGTIAATNRSDRRGAVFEIRLPIPTEADLGEAK